jgi:motility quorum-sensing regulator/GCU-specific mRNA interferase toxin
MSRGRAPHYPLHAVKAAFSSVAMLNRTMAAVIGADDAGIDDQAVIDVIAGLRSSDFEKSMPSLNDETVRQDVYKPVIRGREFYVKFTLDSRGALLLISFKENGP